MVGEKSDSLRSLRYKKKDQKVIAHASYKKCADPWRLRIGGFS